MDLNYEKVPCGIQPGPTSEYMLLCLDDAHLAALKSIIAAYDVVLPDGIIPEPNVHLFSLSADASATLVDIMAEFQNGTDRYTEEQRDLVLVIGAHAANIVDDSP